MKRNILILFLLVFVVSLINCYSQYRLRSESEIRKNPQNIVDYFLILPDDATGEFSTFNERKIALFDRPHIKPTIDLKNAYLVTQENDEVEGFMITVTYFTKSNKNKIIAVNLFDEGGDGSRSYTKFYENDNSNWKEVTNIVLPKITFEDYFKKGEKLAEKKFRIFQTYYNLPRSGTTIEAELVRDFDVRYDDGDGTAYHNFYDNLKSKILLLTWNKFKGIFEIKK